MTGTKTSASVRRYWGEVVGALIVAAVAAGPGLTQGPTWVYWGGKQGSYETGSNTKDNPARKIRFINVEYSGPAELKRWRECFLDAVRVYRKEDVSHPTGKDGDFFEVGGLSDTKKRILGWHDDASGLYGFVVVTRIEGDKVFYTDNNGQDMVVGPTPGNFVRWKIGYTRGDWGPGITYFAAVQLWKHKGKDGPNAGCSFRFREAGGI